MRFLRDLVGKGRIVVRKRKNFHDGESTVHSPEPRTLDPTGFSGPAAISGLRRLWPEVGHLHTELSGVSASGGVGRVGAPAHRVEDPSTHKESRDGAERRVSGAHITVSLEEPRGWPRASGPQTFPPGVQRETRALV